MPVFHAYLQISIFTSNPLLCRLTSDARGWRGEAGQGGNKLKSSLNSFICLWKTLPSSHTHTHTHAAAIRHTGHSQDTHLNDLWRKWRQVCRLSLSLSVFLTLLLPALCNVVKEKPTWPSQSRCREGGRGCLGAGSISWRTWAICNMIEINAKPAHWYVCECVGVCVCECV